MFSWKITSKDGVLAAPILTAGAVEVKFKRLSYDIEYTVVLVISYKDDDDNNTYTTTPVSTTAYTDPQTEDGLIEAFTGAVTATGGMNTITATVTDIFKDAHPNATYVWKISNIKGEVQTVFIGNGDDVKWDGLIWRVAYTVTVVVTDGSVTAEDTDTANTGHNTSYPYFALDNFPLSAVDFYDLSLKYPTLMYPRDSGTGSMRFECRSGYSFMYDKTPFGTYLNSIFPAKRWYSLEYGARSGWKQSGPMNETNDLWNGGPMYSNGAVLNGEMKWIATCVQN